MASCRFNLGTKRVDSRVLLGKVSSLQRSREMTGSAAEAQDQKKG